MRLIYSLFFVLVCCVITGCSATPGPDKTVAGAILGAGWGAGAGAVIGHQVNAVGPGAAIGAGFGALDGAVTGAFLDVAEGTELQQQRELDALKVQVAANQHSLMSLQRMLDHRESRLKTTAVGETVFFDEGRASLRGGSASVLERLADRIKLNPYVGSIEIHGHSEDTGDIDKNMRLSEARARSVATFLSNQGVSIDQMMVVAHGAKRSFGNNKTETGRLLNRRAEVVLKR